MCASVRYSAKARIAPAARLCRYFFINSLLLSALVGTGAQVGRSALTRRCDSPLRFGSTADCSSQAPRAAAAAAAAAAIRSGSGRGQLLFFALRPMLAARFVSFGEPHEPIYFNYAREYAQRMLLPYCIVARSHIPQLRCARHPVRKRKYYERGCSRCTGRYRWRT